MPREDFERRRKRIAGEFAAGQKEYFAGKHKRRLEEIREAGKIEKDIRMALADIAEKGAMSRLLKTQEFEFPERQARLSAQRADLSQKLQDVRVGGKLVEGETGAGVKYARDPGEVTTITGTRKRGLVDLILKERGLEVGRLEQEMAGAEAEPVTAKPGSAVSLADEVATPLPKKKKGLLRSYTDAYFRSSSTPLGYGLGLQGINQALQSYFKYVGEPFERGIVRPTVKGLRWLVTPQQQRRRVR